MYTVKWDLSVKPTAYSCRVCGVKYDVELGSGETIGGLFEEEKWFIDHTDLFSHATTFAEVIRKSRGRAFPAYTSAPWPVTRTFFEVISRARYFIHFTSWGISHKMIGALKLASVRVPVDGWASNVEGHARVELTEYPDEAPNFRAKVFGSDRGVPYDAPHQKLVIVDGLVAFKGSANLTNAGMRRADRGLDIHETVTDYAEVATLNNEYFSPTWRRVTAPADTFAWPAEEF